MKALVGVDGSSNSLAAVDFAGRLLSPLHDQLLLCYAVPEMALQASDGLDPTVIERAQQALSRTVLDEAMSRLPNSWQEKAEPIEQVGAPGENLLAAAGQHGVGLIVVGFRGTSLFEQVVLGSVSRAVVHSATVPVLVVTSEPQGDAERPVGGMAGPLRVLVGYDGEPIAARISAVLNEFHWPENTSGTVMTVVSPFTTAELPDWLQQKARDPNVSAMAAAWKQEHQQLVQQAKRRLEEFMRSLPKCFASEPPIVAEGRHSDKLLSTLAERPFELVVVGSRGRGTVARLLLGSTTDQVLAAAPCSVLVVR